MRLINNDEVNRVLTMADCIRVQEAAFRKIPDGGAIHRPRIDLYYPSAHPESYFRWGSMEGANDGYFAIRMKSDIVSWPRAEDGSWTEEKYCMEPGTYCGLIFLVSTRNGEPLAFINDGVLQHMRVGGGGGHRCEISLTRGFECRRHDRIRWHGADLPRCLLLCPSNSTMSCV